jgi:hypothetical protein
MLQSCAVLTSIHKNAVLRIRIRIRIRRIHMFLGLLDPDSDPLVRGMDPAGSGSFYHQEKIVRKTLIPAVF